MRPLIFRLCKKKLRRRKDRILYSRKCLSVLNLILYLKLMRIMRQRGSLWDTWRTNQFNNQVRSITLPLLGPITTIRIMLLIRRWWMRSLLFQLICRGTMSLLMSIYLALTIMKLLFLSIRKLIFITISRGMRIPNSS